MADIHNVVIIGSGPAGLTAAIYLARANLKPVVIAGLEFGGQLMNTTEVENFPGFPEGIMGPELMQKMLKQAERFGAEIKFINADKVDFSSDEKKVYSGEQVFNARSIVLATGASPKKLNLESESKYWGKGVSSCATCDGAFYKGKVVAVIGGGDSAMEEALFLTRFASKVYVIHRRNEFRASQIMQDRVLKHEKIEPIWDSEVVEVLGNENIVTGLRLKNIQTSKESELSVDGMFLGIGHIPTTSFLQGSVDLDEQGYIKVSDNTHTNIEGVFVAGDVHDHKYRQAITAAGMGCMAALDVEKWLESKGY
ncbi:MAG: thioredoxin-disulfide reductase [Candidatus Dojkabacteria bacterium]|uniref:Thioredoxin reductase n=1 Tax=Candidatus Dojkabacteria bacterium TaxID=2099670 RepID=A0A952AHV5_9BACT|nr:thioredoxin-disulfide reductase [Candidatus Dojkabacteria bacterium]WKZ27816.1 MAG: thioredoxin-disulfide reductase [Candidatus Dojkabacteria bacterium]